MGENTWKRQNKRARGKVAGFGEPPWRLKSRPRVGISKRGSAQLMSAIVSRLGGECTKSLKG